MKPAPKTNELLGRVNALRKSGSDNMFALNRLKKEAEALLKTDAPGAYSVLGAIATLEKDIPTMQRYHKAAINAAPGSVEARINYATSLRNLGLYEEAITEAETVAAMTQKSDPEIVYFVLETLTKVARFHDARAWGQVWNKLRPGEDNHTGEVAAKAAAIMEKCGLDDGATYSVVAVARDVLHRHKLYPESSDLALFGDEVAIGFFVESNPKETANLNAELADALVEQELIPMVSPGFTVTIFPMPQQ